MRKPTPAAAEEEGKQTQNLASMDTVLLHSCPNIMAALATVRYTDGTPRKTGHMVIRIQGTTWSVILKDNTTRLELQGSGLTIDDAVAAVELMLGMDRPPWIPMYDPEENKSKKSK